jgi:glycerol 2-dehydrogenase (NADP+)
MEEIMASGKAKAIGNSNAGIPIIEHLSKTWKVVPAVNQIENHPYNPEHELVKYCKEKGILIQAYSPLGSTGKLNPCHCIYPTPADLSRIPVGKGAGFDQNR